MSANGGLTPSPEIALRNDEIIRMRTELRMPPRKIAKQFSISTETVESILREFVRTVRSRQTDRIEQAFVEQAEILEHWLERVQTQLAKGFDKDLVKVGIMVLERQAKLLGLDKGASSNASSHGWMTTANDEELTEVARRLGLHVPEKLDLQLGA